MATKGQFVKQHISISGCSFKNNIMLQTAIVVPGFNPILSMDLGCGCKGKKKGCTGPNCEPQTNAVKTASVLATNKATAASAIKPKT
jgi:hypothetical protein